LKPLIYLEIRQIINSFRYAGRKPKRLIPAVIFGLSVLMSVVQSLLFAGGVTGSGKPDIETLMQVPIEVIKPVLAMLIVGAFLIYRIGRRAVGR